MKRTKFIPKSNSKLLFLGILIVISLFLFTSSFFQSTPIELKNPHTNNHPDNKPKQPLNSSNTIPQSSILPSYTPNTLEESIVNSAKSFVVTTYRPDAESYAHHFLGHQE